MKTLDPSPLRSGGLAYQLARRIARHLYKGRAGALRIDRHTAIVFIRPGEGFATGATAFEYLRDRTDFLNWGSRPWTENAIGGRMKTSLTIYHLGGAVRGHEIHVIFTQHAIIVEDQGRID